MSRPEWREYFLSIAREVSFKASCPRASVGAVIVKDHRIIATGYNGSPPGEPHCIDGGCIMVDNHCIRAVHAEVNAVAQAAKFGLPIDGSTMYIYGQRHVGGSVVVEACNNCGLIMKAAGITMVVQQRWDEIAARLVAG